MQPSVKGELHELPADLRRRIERCRRELANLGLVLRGSIVERYMPCGRQGCRCQAEPPVLHGPYYQWTRKVDGKTVTVRVKPDEAKLLRQWIANGRRLDKLIGRMERVCLRLTERLIRSKPRS